MSLFPDAPTQPISNYAEAHAVAFAQRRLEDAVNLVATSDAIKKIQDYRKAEMKTLVPALVNAQVAGYMGHNQAAFLDLLQSIAASQQLMAEKLTDIAESLDYLAASSATSEG